MKFKFIIICLLYSIVVFSQEKKLKFYSISFSPINIYVDNHSGGLAFSLDVSLKKEMHRYKLFGQTGGEVVISIFGPSKKESFVEFDLLYGREIKAKKWLYFDFYGGVGYFQHTITKPERISGSGISGGGYRYKYIKEKKATIGIPLQSLIRFKTNKRFSLGLQLHANINSVNTIYSTGIFLQWKLSKKLKLD